MTDATESRALAGTAAQVATGQLALAVSNYAVLAVASRDLDPSGFVAISSYYLLVNTVGRGLFAAVEVEATRAVAEARAGGWDDRPVRRAAVRHTAMLLGAAFVLLIASSPLISGLMGSGLSAIVLLAVGAVGMSASYLLRGPLAGQRRYGLYSATFWIEAVIGIAGAAALALLGYRNALLWIAVVALAPLMAALLVARPALRGGGEAGHRPPAGVRSPASAVVWSAALLLAGQGVWNLAPVVVNSRLTTASAVGAGFLACAVIIRAPVLFFQAVQALLLPMFAATEATGDGDALRRTTRMLGAFIVVAGAVWVGASVLVVPAVARLVFNAPVTPPAWLLIVLAVSVVLGAVAQIGQTHLIAIRCAAAVAGTWIAGLGVLLVIALVAEPPQPAAAVGQLTATVVVLAVFTFLRRRHSMGGS